MLGKNKKIKEEFISTFKFSDVISRKLLFTETHCEVYQAKLVNDKTEYLMKEILIDNVTNKEEAVRKELFLINKINSTIQKPKTFLKFHGYVVIEDTQTFERSFLFFFDLVPENLALLLKRKKSTKARFNFQEIYSLYRALLNCLTYTQLRHVRHRKICPQNIFCESDEELYFSSIRVSDFAPAEEPKNKTKQLFGNNISDFEVKYLSPEERNSGFEEEVDFYKADVFALGILLLEMGTFMFPTNLEYNEQQYIFVNTSDLAHELADMIKEMRRIYSERIKPVERAKFEFFIGLLESMLSLDPATRPDFIELYKKSIFMSEEDILNHMMIEEKRYTMEGFLYVWTKFLDNFNADLAVKKTGQQGNSNSKFFISSLVVPKKNEEAIEIKFPNFLHFFLNNILGKILIKFTHQTI